METGLYVTFFDPGEPVERELPPVGPLDGVVVCPHRLVADRAVAHQTREAGAEIARWLEAELELQRALGVEPGGTKRSELRVSASDGVYLRFAAFGHVTTRDATPELGPYAVVAVGTGAVAADGRVLATRAADAWRLTSAAGDALAGEHRPDIAFRSAATPYHASLANTAAPRSAADAHDTAVEARVDADLEPDVEREAPSEATPEPALPRGRTWSAIMAFVLVLLIFAAAFAVTQLVLPGR